MEYVSLHGYIRNTPSGTEVHAEDQLSGQEYLTSRKEYIDPHKTQDQALSLWTGSTDSKTLDYQRTNPRGYQTVRIHTKETTGIQDPASPNHQQHPVQDTSSKQQTNKKYKPNHQQIRLPPHLSLAHQRRNKQTNKEKLSTDLTL